MSRLTKIDKYGHPYTNENVNCRNLVSKDGINYQFVELENGVNAYDGKPIDKLYAIENIEEELGIPLEVLFKAMKDGVWIREYPEDEPSFHSVGISCVKGRWFISTDFDRIMNVNCFKSAWAFTKEELE